MLVSRQWRIRLLYTIIAVVSLRVVPSAAILHPRYHPIRASIHRPGQRDVPSVLFSSCTNTTDVEDVHLNDTTAFTNDYVLTLRSQFETESQALPVCDLPLKEFFERPEHISFGKSLPSRIIPPTPELMEQWAAACHRVGASLPSPDNDNSLDVILSVRTAGISFPGLKLEWSALIGVRLMDKLDTDSLPELEFVLIRDETNANGAKPLVWFYNKMNKGTKNQSAAAATEARKTNFLTRFGFHRSQEDTIIFRCTGSMEMTFRVPSAARRLVGPDKAKTEKRVSELISRQIEKDIIQSVDHWEENFRLWAGEYEKRNSNTEDA